MENLELWKKTPLEKVLYVQDIGNNRYFNFVVLYSFLSCIYYMNCGLQQNSVGIVKLQHMLSYSKDSFFVNYVHIFTFSLAPMKKILVFKALFVLPTLTEPMKTADLGVNSGFF